MNCPHCGKDVNPIPYELKSTYQSSSRAIEDNPHWIKQIMAQCSITGSPVAYLSRFELMGNYKSMFGKKEEKGLPENARPTLHAYRLEFTKEELDRNWVWLKERRDLFLKILETKELLPKVLAVPSGQDWEANMCSYRSRECSKCQ